MKTKQVLSILLVLCMLAAMVPGTVFADGEETEVAAVVTDAVDTESLEADVVEPEAINIDEGGIDVISTDEAETDEVDAEEVEEVVEEEESGKVIWNPSEGSSDGEALCFAAAVNALEASGQPGADGKYGNYLCLGDSISAGYGTAVYKKWAGGSIVRDGTVLDGTFAKIVGNALAADSRQGSRCGWRSSDLMFALTEKGQNGGCPGGTVNDMLYTSIGMVTKASVLRDMAQTLKQNIINADLMTVGFGANDVYDYALLNAIFNAPADAGVPNITVNGSGLSAMLDTFVQMLKGAKDAGRLLSFFFEKLDEGLANMQRDFAPMLQELRRLNPNAKIVVLSMDNPLKVNLGGFDFEMIGLSTMYKVNDVIQRSCWAIDNCQYVDINGAEYYGLNSVDLEHFDAYEALGAIHPNENGHAYIAQKIISAVKSGLETPKVSAKLNSLGQTKLSWNKIPGAVSYRVYRSTSKFENYKLIGTALTNSYTDILSSSKTAYWYRVYAVMNLAGTVITGASAPEHVHVSDGHGIYNGDDTGNAEYVGYHGYFCKVCSEPYDFEEHRWVRTEVSATCEKGGYSCERCSVCGAEQNYQSTEPLGHSYGDWHSVSATQHQRVCKNDGSHVETANHNFNGGSVCIDCGYDKGDALRAAKDKAIAEITKAAGSKPSAAVKALLDEGIKNIEAAKNESAVNTAKNNAVSKINAQIKAEQTPAPTNIITAIVTTVVKSILSIFGIRR